MYQNRCPLYSGRIKNTQRPLTTARHLSYSSEQKKTPNYKYVPGRGLVLLTCGICPSKVEVYSILYGGNPFASGSNILNGGTPFGSGMLIYDGGKP